MYLVSILVPIYKVEKYIERCARSLFEQTYDNLEYIFVDDCSPDNSIAILEEVMEDYPERKPKVRILRHERNRGLAAARNTALDAAQGSFLSHVDSDDYLDRDAIRLLVNKQVETGADIVLGDYYEILPSGTRQIKQPIAQDKYNILKKVISPTSTLHNVCRRIIRLSLYNDYHIRAYEGVNLMEDFQQSAMLFYYAKKIAKIDNCIYYYDRTNNGSYTFLLSKKSTRRIELWKQSIKATAIVEDFFVNKEPEYYEMARRAKLIVLKCFMSVAARLRKRQSFEKIKRIITLEYADCYDEIGWNNPLLRAFMCNYTLNGTYRRFLRTIKITLHR